MIDMQIKSLFFDRQKVIRAVDKAKRRALSRAGAFVRTRARSSIRKRKATSEPGNPPSSHEGSLRKYIFFAYDRANDSVVIGPVGFNGSEAPSLLEFGGTVPGRNQLINVGGDVERGAGGKFVSTKRLVKAKGRLRYKPRPYMRPALEAERDNLPEAFKNSVVRS